MIWSLLRELLETTCQLANTLKSHGVRKGDRVAIYMPASPIAVAAMLACARIGAIHTVVFAGFSSDALAGRIQDGEDTWNGTRDESVTAHGFYFYTASIVYCIFVNVQANTRAHVFTTKNVAPKL